MGSLLPWRHRRFEASKTYTLRGLRLHALELLEIPPDGKQTVPSHVSSRAGEKRRSTRSGRDRGHKVIADWLRTQGARLSTDAGCRNCNLKRGYDHKRKDLAASSPGDLHEMEGGCARHEDLRVHSEFVLRPPADTQGTTTVESDEGSGCQETSWTRRPLEKVANDSQCADHPGTESYQTSTVPFTAASPGSRSGGRKTTN